MADDKTSALAEMLAQYGNAPEVERYPYGRPRFPNLDFRAYFDEGTRKAYAQEPWYEGLPAAATAALLAMRPGSASGSMRPFNPKAPEAPLPKRPDTSLGDNGVPQHIYEALLGRTRDPRSPHAPAPAGSAHVGGHWLLPKSPLAWLGAALAGYGGAKVGDAIFDPDDKVKDDIKHRWSSGKWPEDDPAHAAYPAAQKRREERAADRADFQARYDDFWLAKSAGLMKDGERWPVAKSTWGPPYPPRPDYTEQLAKLAPYRLPGGVGNAPY